MASTGNSERFYCFDFEISFLKKRKNFSEKQEYRLSLTYHDRKPNISIQNCQANQKPMLGQIEKGIQNGFVTKIGFATNTSYF